MGNHLSEANIENPFPIDYAFSLGYWNNQIITILKAMWLPFYHPVSYELYEGLIISLSDQEKKKIQQTKHMHNVIVFRHLPHLAPLNCSDFLKPRSKLSTSAKIKPQVSCNQNCFGSSPVRMPISQAPLGLTTIECI